MDYKDERKRLSISLDDELPQMPEFVPGVRRAPNRGYRLTRARTGIALKNALRYIPPGLQQRLAPEFLQELVTRGRIYGYRFRPPGRIKAGPVQEYPGKCLAGKAFQVMIDNNLDFDVALYPYELVTYGETGRVCQNWMQYRLIKKYLQVLTEDQTLVVQSGHPLGLFASRPESPRVIITNGLLVGMYDNHEDWELGAQMGVTSYGQMTAGGWMYIGPQGIVHGTYNTLLNAGRLKLGLGRDEDLRGRIFVSSGLGGMSGAQPKAAEIAGAVSIIAEVDDSRIKTRRDQGWVGTVSPDLEEVLALAREAADRKETLSIAYHGNIVDLLERIVARGFHIDLLSDQTSCHAAYAGGYCPQGVSCARRSDLLDSDHVRYRELVDSSLKRHFELIKTLVERGTYFFDYGNAFMDAVLRAGVPEIARNGRDAGDGFIFPSYVEDIMGPLIFDYGFGPFRWVCLSGRPKDLIRTDQAALECIDPAKSPRDRDNYVWIQNARANNLVVGTQARILYQDAAGRVKIALRFNELVREGSVGPIMLGRDHHDPGGTDSPLRETANIKDGSNITADMAIQCFAGNAARGMSLVALHNGGGTGIGKAVNGGFGLVLDGSREVDDIIRSAVTWDVMGGVARRGWAGNEHALAVSQEFNRHNAGGAHITLPFIAGEDLVRETLEEAFGPGES